MQRARLSGGTCNRTSLWQFLTILSFQLMERFLAKKTLGLQTLGAVLATWLGFTVAVNQGLGRPQDVYKYVIIWNGNKNFQDWLHGFSDDFDDDYITLYNYDVGWLSESFNNQIKNKNKSASPGRRVVFFAGTVKCMVCSLKNCDFTAFWASGSPNSLK